MRMGAMIVQHFDLVNYVIRKYRTVLITEIAEVFFMNVMDLYEVYAELGIDPLEIAIKSYKETEFEDGTIVNNIDNSEVSNKRVKRVYTKQYIQIKPSPTFPNRESNKEFKRIKGVYSNTSPYGIASKLHNSSGEKKETDAESKENL